MNHGIPVFLNSSKFIYYGRIFLNKNNWLSDI